MTSADGRVLSGRAAIAGVGATEFSKDSGRSELRLAVDAILDALDDAGLGVKDVDGLVTFTIDNNDEIEVAKSLGIRELTFFARTPYGGGPCCTTVQLAAMAVATGVAEVVVAYRAMNERSGRRFGQPALQPLPRHAWYSPFGLATPASRVALLARRYMHETGATSEDFGRVSVIDRKHAATNPKAWFHGRPITIEEHQASPWVVDPLRRLDCCQESDGGVAIVVTSVARARSLRQRPVVIRAAASGSALGQEAMTSYYRPHVAALPEMEIVGRQLWDEAGIRPADLDVAILYDHFTPLVLIQLEALGFCGRGEAPDLMRTPGYFDLDGELPLNPHGGLLGEAYIHGLNGIAEAARQVRGTAANQIDEVENVLVTGGTMVPTSALVLGPL